MVRCVGATPDVDQGALVAIIAALVSALTGLIGLLVRAVIRGDLIAGSTYRDLRDQNRDLRKALGITGEVARKVASKSSASD
jgi:hypothetical protein